MGDRSDLAFRLFWVLELSTKGAVARLVGVAVTVLILVISWRILVG